MLLGSRTVLRDFFCIVVIKDNVKKSENARWSGFTVLSQSGFFSCEVKNYIYYAIPPNKHAFKSKYAFCQAGFSPEKHICSVTNDLKAQILPPYGLFTRTPHHTCFR
jgi:hypothetical protein